MLSGVIAVAGVAGDSTATVIGAMIVAPLSTPILGIGYGIVIGRAAVVGRSVFVVLLSVVTVVVLGVVVAQVLANPTSVLANSQVTGRTSPTLMDLFAAIATGFVGAVAIARRDVGDVFPGVAIAISLVPPLAVVGVCLGSGAPSLALGAAVLFTSNVLALVVACTVVLLVGGDAHEAVHDGPAEPRRVRAYLVLTALFVVVLLPMSTNSLSSVWAGQVHEAARHWLHETEFAQVQGVTVHPDLVEVDVLAPDNLPALEQLQLEVDKIMPWNPQVVVEHTVGRRIGSGTG